MASYNVPYKIVTQDNIGDFKNFKWSELACHCGGKYCTPHDIGYSYQLLQALQDIRTHFGKKLFITSPTRCVQHNANTKGSSVKSKHTWYDYPNVLGTTATDFYVQGKSYEQVKSYVLSIKSKYNITYYYKVSGSVMHLQVTPSTKFNLTRVLKPLCKGNDVKELQKELQKRGYDLGKYGVDGKFGKNNSYTSKAVKQFQTDSNLTCDGLVGKNTAHELGWTYKGE